MGGGGFYCEEAMVKFSTPGNAKSKVAPGQQMERKNKQNCLVGS